MKRFFATATLLTLTVLLSACADTPTTPEARAEAAAIDDPLEPVNRVTFQVNDYLDRFLLKPAAQAYVYVVPEYARDRVANVLSNMGEPVIFANDLLQGRLESAGITVGRFVVNTTVGLAGIFEVAQDWDMPKQMGDFGQTLSTWGINGGPYLVLPLFGPSNFRDAIGFGVDSAAQPWPYLAGIGGNGTENRLIYSELAADGLTRRSQTLHEYDALKTGSIDFYAEMRSVYSQYRDKQLGITNPNALPNYNDIQ